MRLLTRFVTALPRMLGAIAVLTFGPLIGILIGGILAMLALSPDPNFSGHSASGDGFLVILYIAISLVISIPISVFGAGLLLFSQPAKD